MTTWIEPAANMFFGAFVYALLIKYRDKGILRRICESKRQFRTWVKNTAN